MKQDAIDFPEPLGFFYNVYSVTHRQLLRVASGATTPGPALEGAPRFKPKVVLMSLSSIPIEILILWPRAVMVRPRPRALPTPPLVLHPRKQ
jgi:hypothetical protein